MNSLRLNILIYFLSLLSLSSCDSKKVTEEEAEKWIKEFVIRELKVKPSSVTFEPGLGHFVKDNEYTYTAVSTANVKSRGHWRKRNFVCTVRYDPKSEIWELLKFEISR